MFDTMLAGITPDIVSGLILALMLYIANSIRAVRAMLALYEWRISRNEKEIEKLYAQRLKRALAHYQETEG